MTVKGIHCLVELGNNTWQLAHTAFITYKGTPNQLK